MACPAAPAASAPALSDDGKNKSQATARDAESPGWLTGQPIAVRVSGDPDPANNGLFYLHTDHLGSVSAIWQANGTVQQTRYLPFGGYRAGSGPNSITSHAHTHQQENMDIGLYYYNARYYAPTLACFLSPDTIVPDPANPQLLNRYSYVLNSPLRYTDPTGHLSEDEIEEYFGFTDKQEMIDVYGEAVTNLIWGTDFTWGDVLQYECVDCYGGFGYAMLLLLGNLSDGYRGAFWGLQAFHNGHDFRGKEITRALLQEATEAKLDLNWTQSYQGYDNIPVDYAAYGFNPDEMIAGVWHDIAFWRPVVFIGSFFLPETKAVKVVEGIWTVTEETLDDVIQIGHPLGEYLTVYPTIQTVNEWRYLPAKNHFSFLSPRPAFN